MLKKLNALLHEVTIIDFRYVTTLVSRYRRAAYILPVVVFLSVTFFYSQQHTIYQQKIDFKVDSKSGSAKLSPMASMMGEGTELFTAEEIMNLPHNYEFNVKVAESILEDNKYMTLDLSSPTSTNKITMKELLKDCHQTSCKVNRIASAIGALYAFESTSINNRYSLTATTTDENTTKVVLTLVSRILTDSRLSAQRSTIKRQIDVVNDLWIKAQKDLESKGGSKSLEEESLLKSTIAETQDKLRSISMSLNSEKASLSSLGLKLGHNKKTISQNSDLYLSDKKQGKLNYEEYVKLQEKQKELRHNLNTMMANTTNPSVSEKVLMNQIKTELETIEKEIKQRKPSANRIIAYDEKFVSMQQNNESTLEFDHRVQDEKVKALKIEYSTLRKSLDELLSKKAVLETKMLTLNSEIQYLTQLETKIMTLKLTMASVTSDVVFELPDPNVSIFKRSSLTKITFFCALLSFFCYFIAIIFYYLYDDRVHSEQEIERVFAGMKILGKTPEFKN